MTDCLGFTSNMLSINQMKLDLPYEKVEGETQTTNGHDGSENDEEMERDEDDKADKIVKSKKKERKSGKSEFLITVSLT